MKVNAFWGNIFRGRDADSEAALAIRRVPIFEDLSKRELAEVERLVHRRTYSAGEAVFWDGDPGAGMYIILSGAVNIMDEQPDGKEHKLARLEQGEFFGELGLLDETPRSASAIADEDAVIIGFFRTDLLSLIERRPKLGIKIVLNLARVVGERLRQANAALVASGAPEVASD